MIENVRYLAKEVFGYDYILPRNGKNICCKGSRLLSGFNDRYWNVWEVHFPLFEIYKVSKRILFWNVKHDRPLLTFEGGTWATSLTLPILVKKHKGWMEKFDF